MANIQYKHPKTLWETIKFKLEVKIINGTYKSADKVPSMAELSEMYGIGKSTAKKVLESLYEEGIITKKRGVGYFVKPLTRNKLKGKHLKKLDGGLKEYILMAKEMKIEKELLNDKIKKLIDEIY